MTFWADQMIRATQHAGSRFVLADEPTFFEKHRADAVEAECQLGVDQPSLTRFALHQRYARDFLAAREQLARRVLGTGNWTKQYQDFAYIDEFHYRAETIGRIADLIAVDAHR